MAKEDEEVLDLLLTPERKRRTRSSQSPKKTPSKKVAESSAPDTLCTSPVTRSSRSKAGPTASTPQKKEIAGVSKSPSKPVRDIIPDVVVFIQQMTSKSGPSNPATMTSAHSADARVKLEGSVKKKSSAATPSSSTSASASRPSEASNNTEADSISHTKRDRSHKKSKRHGKPSDMIPPAVPQTPQKSSNKPATSASIPATIITGYASAIAALAHSSNPPLNSKRTSGSSPTSAVVTTESSNHKTADSIVSDAPADSTPTSPNNDVMPPRESVQDANDEANSSSLADAETPATSAPAAALDSESAPAVAENTTPPVVPNSSPARHPSQMPVLSPLSSPKLRAAEASIMQNREDSFDDPYPLREMSSDIDLPGVEDFWAGIKQPSSFSQLQLKSQVPSASQVIYTRSASQILKKDMGKKLIKHEDSKLERRTSTSRKVSFNVGEGADINQPIDVDILELDDGPCRPTQQSQTNKRKRGASSSVSFEDSHDPFSSRASPPPPALQSKRKRSRASSARGSSKSLHRHSRFWQLDGSVIIQVESILFRLHRSRLHRASGEDEDEEEDKRSEEEDREMIDRCPVYEVSHSQVTAREFEKVLAAMEDGVTYIKNPPPFSDLISILRVSTHLSFPKYREWALAEIEDMWGGDLDGLISQEGDGNWNNARYGKGVQTKWATKMVLVARECGLRNILKRTLYELLRAGGFAQPDKDEDEVKLFGQGPGNARVCIFDDEDDEDRSDELPPALLRKLLVAREHLLSEWIRACKAEGFLCPQATLNGPASEQLPSPDSSSPAHSCPTAEEKAVAWNVTGGMGSTVFQKYLYDPICGLSYLMNIDLGAGGLGFCEGCVEVRKAAWLAHRQKIWDNLGIWLGIAAL
ncbi:hypothetical protein NEOLEDRAFT_1147465 [Neolentinus lepideus HHB14362 ss-1]|uniref:BTB domain-containing protein n=1 Tax=Neolentinus lepideus HHB14362 ss-1 TaxID=1314782 RepID=A0A165T2E0_9AGAM|nr:hypothetical protein NEOLEDRAFT_1147465 [Neolentinus lepideus HHB14362 ss-1]